MSAAGKRCPSDGDFLASYAKEMDEPARDAFIDHVFLCRACRLKFDALRALEREIGPDLAAVAETPLDGQAATELQEIASRRLREAKAGSPRRAPRPRWRILAWTAPVALAAILAGYFLAVRGAGPAPTRSTPSLELRLIAPIGRVAGVPAVFSWEPIASADYYVYKVIDEELNVILSDSAQATAFRLDEVMRAKMVRNKTYLWTVEARNDAGIPIAEAKAAFIVR